MQSPFELIEIETLLRHLLSMASAYVLTLPIAWDRERRDRSAGLRTFPLVAVASCAFLLLGQRAFPGTPGAQARLVAGLITGIGFIGGGAILKGEDRIHGTATATSIWLTGGIGGCVAYEAYDIALLLSVLGYVTLRLMSRVKEHADEIDDHEEP